MATKVTQIAIAQGRQFDARRYVKYVVKDGGNTLKVWLDNPREILEVAGGDAVQSAQLAIQQAFDDLDPLADERLWRED